MYFGVQSQQKQQQQDYLGGNGCMMEDKGEGREGQSGATSEIDVRTAWMVVKEKSQKKKSSRFRMKFAVVIGTYERLLYGLDISDTDGQDVKNARFTCTLSLYFFFFRLQ